MCFLSLNTVHAIMYHLILVFYIMLLGCWIKSSALFSVEGLSRKFIFLVFLSKIIAGISYGFIHTHYFSGGDTFLYLKESTAIGQSIFVYPQYYLYSLMGWATDIPDKAVFIYPESAIFWKDLGSYVLVHWHGLLHPLTWGNYNLTIFFIAVIGLLASLNFYTLFKKVLALPPVILIICCFFLPSLTFWTSGFHKDVYVYYALSLLFLGLHDLEQSSHWKQSIPKIIVALLILGLIRHYLLFLVLPASTAFFFSLKNDKHLLFNYGTVYTVFIISFFIFFQFALDIHILEILADKQAAFIAETGGSKIKDINTFSPSILGVFGALPMAIVNVLARPFLWECTDFLQVLASFEILCFLLLVLVSFLIKKQTTARPKLLLPFLLSFSISNLLLIGLLVVNSGTIVRYRSIALGLLTLLIMRIIDFRKVGLNTTECKTNHDTAEKFSPHLTKNKKKHSKSQKSML